MSEQSKYGALNINNSLYKKSVKQEILIIH